MSRLSTPHFPFSAVAGQASFKLALILAAINPSIGGVLISGPRGCAKSTLARGMADLLPTEHPTEPSVQIGTAQFETADSAFVTLPLGASEEMLVGTLDLQKVLNDQNVAFSPGLLSKAHNGVLYVDEVNLLADNLVDMLLDVAVSGINHVERDGISHNHAAEFLLIGTMNPDEGELRPQLHDRFGLSVELSNQYEAAERVEIVRSREDFDLDPQAFCLRYVQQQTELRDCIEKARAVLRTVSCSDPLRFEIAERCNDAQVDGLRADIVWYRAALAHAAWNGRSAISLDDIDAVEELVLAHRRKSQGQSSGQPQNPKPPSGSAFRRPPERPEAPRNTEFNNADANRPDEDRDHDQNQTQDQESAGNSGDWGQMEPQQQKIEVRSNLSLSQLQREQRVSAQLSRPLAQVSKQKGEGSSGYRIGSKEGNKPNWFSTLVENAGIWPPKKLRFHQETKGQPVLHFVLLDTSASTLGHGVFSTAKAAVLHIAEQAYLNREQLAILGFGNNQVDTLLPRIRAPKELMELLNEIPAGGGTPIREAMQQAQLYLQKLQRQTPQLQLRSYILTDGRSNARLTDIRLPGSCVLIDTEQSQVKRSRGKQLATDLGATYLPLPV